MPRHSKYDLAALVKQINNYMGAAHESWSNGHANIGNHHLLSDDSGKQFLVVVANEFGGIRKVTPGELTIPRMYRRALDYLKALP